MSNKGLESRSLTWLIKLEMTLGHPTEDVNREMNTVYNLEEGLSLEKYMCEQYTHGWLLSL